MKRRRNLKTKQKDLQVPYVDILQNKGIWGKGHVSHSKEIQNTVHIYIVIFKHLPTVLTYRLLISFVQCDGENIETIVWRHFSCTDRYLSIDLYFLISIYPSFYLSICLKCCHSIAMFSQSHCTVNYEKLYINFKLSIIF